MMVEAVIVGGTDTTRNQLGCAVALFAEHPSSGRCWPSEPELAPRAVEEAMRYFGACAGRAVRQRGHRVPDVLFPAGTFIAPSMATANSTGGVRRPEVFDITASRPASRS
jgi:cytochrome P450